MIGLTSGKIAVDPIFDKRETDQHNALTRAEKELLKSQGIEYSENAPSFQIPDSAIEKCDQGIVKYVHPKAKEEFDIDIGDYVLFSGYTGKTVRLEGEGLLIIMHAEFVICKIHPPETDVPGLFFQDANGEYWNATSEMAIDLIRRRFEEIGAVDVRNAEKPSRFVRG